VRIGNRNIFDLADEKENGILYRAANAIHVRTQDWVVRRQLLFKPGERVSVRLIEETERLMRSNRIFYEVSIVPIAYRDGVVDIEVRTRDTWTLQPGLSASRAGGVNRPVWGLRTRTPLAPGFSSARPLYPTPIAAEPSTGVGAPRFSTGGPRSTTCTPS